MSACDDCDLRGYSRELCIMHVRHCRQHPDARPATTARRVVARAAGGVALGVCAALVLATAASFVGGPDLFYALVLKLVVATGLVGGGWSVVRGLAAERERHPATPLPGPRRPPLSALSPRRGGGT